MHHDILNSSPTGVKPLGSSAACEVQGMFRPRSLLTLQSHPEFDGDIMIKLLDASNDLGFNDKTLWQDSMDRANHQHDGTLVAAAMLQFLHGKFDDLS